jgi:preprotein translocase subunit SecY
MEDSMRRPKREKLSLSLILQSTEVKKRLLFTLCMLVMFRIGAFIPLPAIPRELLSGDSVLANNLINTYDLFAGGTLKALSVFALGIGPYINASIIMQLMTPVVPRLQSLKNEGQYGQREMRKLTRWLTLGLAVIESLMLSLKLVSVRPEIFAVPVPLVVATSTFLLSGAAMLVMFMAENVTEHGIGNGPSLLICAGIASRIPAMIQTTWLAVQMKQTPVWGVCIMVVAFVLLGWGAAVLQNTVKRIQVQGGKGAPVHREGAPACELLLPLNPSGVMPIVFASQFIVFLGIAVSFLFERLSLRDNPWCIAIENFFLSTRWEYALLYAGLILYFAAFYSSIVLPPQDIAETLRKDNKAIVGVKPGKPTIAFLGRTIRRLSLTGAAVVACMAIIPLQLAQWTQVQTLLGFGSTSILIMTGVALDTKRQVVAHALGSRYHTKNILPPGKDEEEGA